MRDVAPMTCGGHRRAHGPRVALGTRLERLLNVAMPPQVHDEDDREAHRRAVPRGRRRRGGRLARRRGADSRRLLARRDRGARDHGAARRHRRHRRDDALVRGRRSRAQLRARAAFRSTRKRSTTSSASSTPRTCCPTSSSDEEEPMHGLASLVRPPAFIPTSKPIDEQLREFQSSRTHIAIVSRRVRRHGRPRHDRGHSRGDRRRDPRRVRRRGAGDRAGGGRAVLGLRPRHARRALRALGEDFAREDVTTVGGLVYELFGRVPRARRVAGARRHSASSSSACAAVASSASTSSGCSRRCRRRTMNDDPSSPLDLVLLVVAWLTAGGMAMRSVSRIWLRHWVERRLRGGGAATIYLERPQRLLASARHGRRRYCS